MLILQIRCYFVLIVSFSFVLFFLVSYFSIFFFNVKNNGVTPLFIAAQKGNGQIVHILLEKGANVDLANEVLLLIVSFSFLFFFFFQFFIFLFFFFNVKNGATPLYIAAFKGDEQIVQILLEKGANVDLANKVLFC